MKSILDIIIIINYHISFNNLSTAASTFPLVACKAAITLTSSLKPISLHYLI